MELKFHNREEIFFDESGKLREEPRRSLKRLLKDYDKACKQYSELVKRQAEAAEPYRRLRYIYNMEPKFMEDTSRDCASGAEKNARWADLTLAFAVAPESPGEFTARKAAGDRCISVQVPPDAAEYLKSTSEGRLAGFVDELKCRIRSHPAYKESGIRLNVAGSGASTLKMNGADVKGACEFIQMVLLRMMSIMYNGRLHVKEVRSGGQTGAEEAGIKAAQYAGVKCSVLAPKGYGMMDEDGVEHEGFEQFAARFKESYIDYDAWEAADSQGCWAYGFGEFNGFNAIDMMEYEIDLKIMHMNARGEDM